MRPVQAFRKHLPIVLVLIAWLLFACTAGAPPRPVPEMDKYYFDPAQLDGQHTDTELVTILGEPPFVFEGDVTEWIYPIRVNSQAIHAPILEIAFDESDRVTTWGFYNPFTNEPLPIRESVEEARQWLEACRISEAHSIELAPMLTPGVTTKDEVLGMLYVYYQTKPIESTFRGTLRYYVDRPSPYYIHPDNYIVQFGEGGVISPKQYFQGGCQDNFFVDPP